MATFIIVLLALLLHPQLTAIDNLFIDYRFNNRGPTPVDSSIVVLTLDDDDLQIIGGHAKIQAQVPLLFTALNDLGARVIGFDIILDELNSDLLNRSGGIIPILRTYRNVCLAVLKKSVIGDDLDPALLSESETALMDTSVDTLAAPEATTVENLLPPSPRLLRAAAGMGHNNFGSETIVRRVPLVIHTSEMGPIRAFALEVVRLYHGLPKDSVQFQPNSVLLNGRNTSISIPANSNKMLINYAGGREHVKTVSALAFLKAYVDYMAGHIPGMPLDFVENKIVLVGLDSHVKGRSLTNPFNEVMPTVFVQANAVNTILNDAFIYSFPDVVTYFILFVVVFIIVYLFLYGKPFRAMVISLVIFIGYLSLSFFLFFENILLPIHPSVIALPTVFFILLYKFGTSERPAGAETAENLATAPTTFQSGPNVDLPKQQVVSQSNENKANKKEKKPPPASHSDGKNGKLGVPKYYQDVDFEKNAREVNGLFFHRNSRFKAIVEMLVKVAPSNAPVLITGESGTGKELAARAIHDNSHRKEQNFVALNCASIQESLLESELFGHEKGAYTGADNQKIGLFEVADGGTIFLDEIAEMSDSLQSKLLRVLQFKEFYRVGGIAPVKVDVRLVAATNKEPEIQLENSLLRKDLYYRISTIRVHMLPLSERREDIPILIRKFLKDEDADTFDMSPNAYNALLEFNWPGNIRQLQSVIQRAVIFAKAESADTILLSHLPNEISHAAIDDQDLEQRILYSLRGKKFSHRSIVETARELGDLNRSTVTGYLRGMCLRELSNSQFDMQEASQRLAGNGDSESVSHVLKKNREYLGNLSIVVYKNRHRDDLVEYLQKKYKNIPKRYHSYLAETVEYLKNVPQNAGI